MRHFKARLPAELTDRVIDHLHSNQPALRTCSLVCKDWLPASRYHLFQTGICWTDRTIHTFVELLSSPASTFVGNALCVRVVPDAVKISEEVPASSIFDTISRHLFKLTIKSLSLISVEWDIKDEKQEDIFGYFATIPALKLLDVTFSAPSQVIKFITSFLSLERLSLCDIIFETHDALPHFTLSPLLHTVDLTLRDRFTFWFLSALQSHPLEYLSISNIEDGNMDVIRHILQSSGPSLHSLTLLSLNLYLGTYYLVMLVFKLIV